MKLILSCYKVQVFSRDYRKSPLDSIITTIATSNRCELDSLENLFSRESLRLDLIAEPALTEKQSNLFLSLANFTVSRDEKKPPSLISSKKPNPVLFLRSKKLILSCYKVQVFSRNYRKSPLDL